MDEDFGWTIFGCVLVVSVALVLMVVVVSTDDRLRATSANITEMVKHGANPIEAGCAIAMHDGCLIVAGRSR